MNVLLALCRSRPGVISLIIMLQLLMTGQTVPAATCTPTPWDEIGPFYRPNPPVRTSIGKGYLLRGTVRSAGDCWPLSNVRIEIWQAGPDGSYGDAYRATLFPTGPGAIVCRPAYRHPMVEGRLTFTCWWMRKGSKV